MQNADRLLSWDLCKIGAGAMVDLWLPSRASPKIGQRVARGRLLTL